MLTPCPDLYNLQLNPKINLFKTVHIKQLINILWINLQIQKQSPMS